MKSEIQESQFYRHFLELYGSVRWPILFEALSLPDQKVGRLNPYVSFEPATDEFQIFLKQKILSEKLARETELKSDAENLFYFLDQASLVPPFVLSPKPGDYCLDMCAAPGGKSLILAQLLAPSPDSELQFIANEISKERRSRLLRVLQEQLPDPIFRQIKVTSHDASKWSQYQKSQFDKILLDAPCSGERYFIEIEKQILAWTLKKSKTMAIRQFSLLASGFDCLKIGGELVYSTCSISHFENDEVIRKLLKKRRGQVEILATESPLGTSTEFGWMILPDTSRGSGPIYFSKLRRV